MPALNFQKQFADAVESGEKCQTIRAFRKDGRDPKPGQTLYLYTGMRTKVCRKLREVECSISSPIRICEDGITFEGHTVPWLSGAASSVAKADGFVAAHLMREWFEKTHGLPFEGLLIRWEWK